MTVSLSDAQLPPVDPTRPAWPGAEETIGGVRLHVRRTPGHGDVPAVYVHGLGGSATNWTDLADQLSGHAPGLAVDLPGFGRSTPPDGYDYTLRAHVDTLVKVLGGLDGRPVHLLGNSMGGAICLLAAAAAPELVRTLTLISPAVPDLRPDPRRLSDPRLALAMLPLLGKRVRRSLAAITPRERTRQMLELCFADPSQVPEQRVAEAEAEYAERAEQAWANPALEGSTIGLIRSWLVVGPRSIWRAAPRITAPTLVIWGTRDRLMSVRKAPRTARAIPNARLLVLPDVGHVAQMERPATVARAVLSLWRSAAGDRW
ncbi:MULTISPECIES: alpha/beta fold hydrolase [Actinokineospora]|uniref:Hydrolase n=1 Tax=Actinokineospora fastidiosa TaxID=1816 RepID=A0A918L693_9PSEU|nr:MULTISPECIES: alpha/beta hydrolase [Actinokineospora]UVS77190.1 Lipase 3 precursor [Actinokineospora sp. UTMC 2448]GGS12857.1 hydrolase [Actinokineospora fastidiosa]